MPHARVQQRLPALDGLRGLAVLAVLAYHAHYGWAQGGFVGVDVFFALSGYLITDLLLSGTVDPATGSVARGGYRDFLVRRARRLMPAYAVMLAAATFCAALLGDPARQAAMPRCLAAAATHTMNLPYVQHLGCDATWHIAWSLAAEEQFYFLWPVTLAVLLRHGPRLRGSRVAGAAAVVMGLACAAVCWQLWLRTGYPRTARVMFAPDGRSLIILLGCATALALRAWPRALVGVPHRLVAAAAWAAAAGLAASVLAGTAGNAPHQLGAPVAAGAATAVLIGLAALGCLPRALERLLAHRLLVSTGTLSYSLYLWHEIAYRIADTAFDRGTPATELARFGLSLALAFLSWRLIETRFAPPSARTDGRPQALPRSRSAVDGGHNVIAAGRGGAD
jgi:peptidoglycan/LPS O-acetylase OafA/YrhL